MQLSIAITTFNRKTVLERMARSFYDNEPSLEYHLLIYDDASDEYNIEYLKELFPNATKVYRRNINIGADAAMKSMYEDFLSGEDDCFFHADADLIFRKNWCEIGLEHLSISDGVLSLLNAPSHVGMIIGNGICEKREIGAAGTFFRRNIVEMFMNELRKRTTDSFDWKWSDVLQRNGIRLLTTEKSYVQHIGFTGHNSRKDNFDFGEGFIVDSLLNGQILNDTIEEFSQIRSETMKVPMAVFPFSEVEKDSIVVIYGAGKFGRDYIQQIESTRYCRVAGIVDKHYLEHEGTVPVQDIKKMDFDYVVVAINDNKDLPHIIHLLEKNGVNKKQIVFKTGIKEITPT